MKLKQPFSPLLTTLANGSVSYFYVLPKEGKGQDANFFNKWAFGGGPFYIDSYEPSVRLNLKRNPNYELRDVQDGGLKRPFIDGVELHDDPGHRRRRRRSSRSASSTSRGLGLTVDDNIQLKKDVPELQMRATSESHSRGRVVRHAQGRPLEGPARAPGRPVRLGPRHLHRRLLRH